MYLCGVPCNEALDRGLTEAQEDLAEAQGRMAQYESGVYGRACQTIASHAM